MTPVLSDISYNMLRGIFGPPDMPKDAVDWYIGFLRKIADTPEYKDYISKRALKAGSPPAESTRSG